MHQLLFVLLSLLPVAHADLTETPSTRRAFCGDLAGYTPLQNWKQGDSIELIFRVPAIGYVLGGYYSPPSGRYAPTLKIVGKKRDMADRALFLDAIQTLESVLNPKSTLENVLAQGQRLCISFPSDEDVQYFAGIRFQSGFTDREALAKLDAQL